MRARFIANCIALLITSATNLVRQRFDPALPLPAATQNTQAKSGSPGASAPNVSELTKAKIFYSGHMFGYLRRDKANQCGNKQDKDCDLAGKRDKASAAEVFETVLHQQGCNTKGGPQSGCILLAMGDDFAPKYEARLEDNGRFKQRDSPTASYMNDNVARFLYEANFTALVPHPHFGQVFASEARIFVEVDFARVRHEGNCLTAAKCAGVR
jgi:hypothetical protein